MVESTDQMEQCIMAESLWRWAGDIHLLTTGPSAGIIVTFAAVVCGGLIGVERERAQKPAGMRTLILICLGSAIFTQASILIAGTPLAGGVVGDRGRIAAQVVSGIGFLGAGAIIRERGLVIGITTAAAIWATAAVGVVLGSGHVAAGVFFTLLIAGTLAASRALDRMVVGPCKYRILEVHFEPAEGKTELQIQAVLDEHLHEGEVVFERPSQGSHKAVIHYCDSHRDHRLFLRPLMALHQVVRVGKH